MLEGIVRVRSDVDERLVRGATARGCRVEIDLNEEHFAGEGDAYLFAVILDRFLALYATLNAFTQTTVRMQKSGVVHEFPVRWGEQITPAEARRRAPIG